MSFIKAILWVLRNGGLIVKIISQIKNLLDSYPIEKQAEVKAKLKEDIKYALN